MTDPTEETRAADVPAEEVRRDAPPEHRTPRRGGCVVGCLTVGIVGYVLSPPIVYLMAMQLAAAGWSSAAEGLMSAITTIYAPLQWLHDNCEPVRDFYSWYSELFEPWLIP